MISNSQQNNLFSGIPLNRIVEDWINVVTKQIIGMNLESFSAAASNLEKYVTDVKSRYPMDIPVLHVQEWVLAGDSEANIRTVHPNHSTISKGHCYDIEIPFEGDPKFFDAIPSNHGGAITHGQIRREENVLRLSFTVYEWTPPTELRQAAESVAQSISNNLDLLRAEIPILTKKFDEKIREAIANRQALVDLNKRRIEALGIPLKKRPDAPTVPTVPVTLKMKEPTNVASSKVQSDSSPILASDNYEQVLEVIHNMALVMERNPSTFSKAEEELIRDHFLVQLNGTFKGEAVGEAFNHQGKTDILIRSGNKNVFIAECKFWRGKAGYIETIDQLLSYSSWRDARTAILIFNKNKNSTSVLNEIDKQTQSYPKFKKKESYQHSSGFRYVLEHPRDEGMELTLTVLVFDIPAPPLSSES